MNGGLGLGPKPVPSNGWRLVQAIWLRRWPGGEWVDGRMSCDTVRPKCAYSSSKKKDPQERQLGH